MFTYDLAFWLPFFFRWSFFSSIFFLVGNHVTSITHT
uniref:Uncharacterized protein n=1 Tax=Anguilla anguilla TaxID=7936 RepID=A0A0E9S0R7_ANGAN